MLQILNLLVANFSHHNMILFYFAPGSVACREMEKGKTTDQDNLIPMDLESKYSVTWTPSERKVHSPTRMGRQSPRSKTYEEREYL